MWIFQPLGLLLLLVWHWICDFVFQGADDAENKWQCNRHLMNHTAVYTILWLPIIGIISCTIKLDTPSIFLFFPITFILHTVTDYITSREVHKQFKLHNNIHNGFVIIGLDQILHYIQIYLTLKILLNA